MILKNTHGSTCLTPTLGGADKVQLYSDAIENMYNNPTAPAIVQRDFQKLISSI